VSFLHNEITQSGIISRSDYVEVAYESVLGLFERRILRNILGLYRMKGSGKEDGKRVKVKLSLCLVK
jgi:hypothetical protein